MADYINSEGAFAENYSSADYSGNFFSYTVDGQHDAYYITRFASAFDHAAASLTNNHVSIYGTAARDEINVNAFVSATDGGSAYSYGNIWFVDLGDGDDAGVIHMAASGVGAGTSVSISGDSADLNGGGGSDVLHATQVLSALDGAAVSIDDTVRFLSGGEGFDFFNVQLTLESGNSSFAGGSANYSFNRLHVNAGADGGDIQATAFITSYAAAPLMRSETASRSTAEM